MDNKATSSAFSQVAQPPGLRCLALKPLVHGLRLTLLCVSPAVEVAPSFLCHRQMTSQHWLAHCWHATQVIVIKYLCHVPAAASSIYLVKRDFSARVLLLGPWIQPGIRVDSSLFLARASKGAILTLSGLHYFAVWLFFPPMGRKLRNIKLAKARPHGLMQNTSEKLPKAMQEGPNAYFDWMALEAQERLLQSQSFIACVVMPDSF